MQNTQPVHCPRPHAHSAVCPRHPAGAGEPCGRQHPGQARAAGTRRAAASAGSGPGWRCPAAACCSSSWRGAWRRGRPRAEQRGRGPTWGVHGEASGQGSAGCVRDAWMCWSRPCWAVVSAAPPCKEFTLLPLLLAYTTTGNRSRHEIEAAHVLASRRDGQEQSPWHSMQAKAINALHTYVWGEIGVGKGRYRLCRNACQRRCSWLGRNAGHAPNVLCVTQRADARVGGIGARGHGIEGNRSGIVAAGAWRTAVIAGAADAGGGRGAAINAGIVGRDGHIGRHLRGGGRGPVAMRLAVHLTQQLVAGRRLRHTACRAWGGAAANLLPEHQGPV